MLDALRVQDDPADRKEHGGHDPVKYAAKHIEAGLTVTVGQHSAAGRKADNEDSMGLWVPSGPMLAHKGAAFVIADGVSAAEAAREASDICVRTFLEDYFSTPDSWTVETSGLKVIESINRWLYSLGRNLPSAARGYVTTMSVLVLKSHTAHIFHVGDTRVHRVEKERLERLTTDHARKVSPTVTFMQRAMGLDLCVIADYMTVPVKQGDVFLLTTDGVHDFIDAELVQKTLRECYRDFDAACARLIEVALDRGSEDNLTCQLVRIDALPSSDADDIYRSLTTLPCPQDLTVGDSLDGYRVEKLLHRSRRSSVYVVVPERGGERVVMKTPSEQYQNDPAYLERFIMERWVQSRVCNDHVVRAVEPQGVQTHLYNLSEYVEGQRLADWIEAHPRPSMEEVLRILKQIALGVEAMHRRETLHQDLKPDNILLCDDGTVKLLDFGSCRVGGIEEIDLPITRDTMLGTIHYAAPEYRRGQYVDRTADLFSIGVIAYEMLTGYLPYEEQIESICRDSDFDKLVYVPSYHYNPEIPVWVDGALRQAVAIDPKKRYQEISEFLFDLEFPNRLFARERQEPLFERNPPFSWRGLCLFLALVNLFLLLLLAS